MELNIDTPDMTEEKTDEKEFQFYKDDLKTNVKEYLDIDDQIKALNKAVKARRDRKKKLSESILKTMKQFEINNMNTSNGKLIYSVTKQKAPLTKKNLLNCLSLYYNNSDKANEVSNYVMENRPQIEKVSLKRKKLKVPEMK